MTKQKQKNDVRRFGCTQVAVMLLVLLLGIGVLPAAAAAASGLKEASLMPLWSPQAQFAGYYVAFDKGIYARHGIDLTILEGGPEHSAAQALQDGTADFAVLWLTTALRQNDSEKRLVNLAQIVQESSMMLVAGKSSGITTPAAMQGKKVGLWGGDLALPAEAFFTKYQLQVNRIPQSYTVNLFLRGGVDVASVMWYNEYHTILMSGVNAEELDLFFLNDYGIAFPEDGLYTLKTSYRQDPALADAFTRASLEGWQYAFDHPQEAVDIVLRYMREAKVPANRTHQTWMLERMRDLIVPQNNDEEMGQLSPSDYAAVTDALRDMGHITTAAGYDDFIGRIDAHH